MSDEPDPRFFPLGGPLPTDFRSDTPTHPGEKLRRELAAHGMSQADLASRTGLSAKHVNQVVQGLALMSADVAIALERVLGTPASMWTRLDARWQEERSRERDEVGLREHTAWTQRFPLKELIRRRILHEDETGASLVDALLQLFRVVSPDAFDRVWLGSLLGGFRRAQQHDCDRYATATWIMLGERQAEKLDVNPTFSAPNLRRILPQLRSLTRMTLVDGFIQARELLAGCGASLVFVESMPGCRACGATWWTANRPVLILSERHKREDIFWFTLFHEIAHILIHPRRMVFVEFAKEKGDDQDGHESEADEFAANFLIPAHYNKSLLEAPVEEIPRVAERFGVGPSIVAGRRAHLTRERPSMSKFRKCVDVAALRNITPHPTR
jgi:HTH-type transcriptional regulator/antitoxin HigA